MVTRSPDAIAVREPVSSMAAKEDTMSSASKATAAKKVPASRPAAAKKATPTKKSALTKAPAAGRTVTPTKEVPPTKKAAPTKNAQAAKKPVPTAKSGGSVNKETTVTKKAVPAAKKSAGPAKKSASTGKAPASAAATAATGTVDTDTPETKAAPAAPARTTFTPKPKPPAPVRPKTGPYAKDPKFLEEITELLAEERAIYQEQATSLRAEADSLALEREPGDVQFDEESGEGGTVTVDRERNLALSGQAALAVEEIDYASERVADKTYGYCERCFQPIPKPRLRALPYARLCVACKSGGLSRR
jgi:RNA polymerase-binding transcription factor DksA